MKHGCRGMATRWTNRASWSTRTTRTNRTNQTNWIRNLIIYTIYTVMVTNSNEISIEVRQKNLLDEKGKISKYNKIVPLDYLSEYIDVLDQ